jgi:acetylornithine/N-succinyldiaminopimelate aminotransferase
MRSAPLLAAGRWPEHLLDNVRRVGACIRTRCLVGPVSGYQGAGFLAGLICTRPAKDIQRALLERDILTGTSADARVLRLLPPFILREAEVELLRAALLDIGP